MPLYYHKKAATEFLFLSSILYQGHTKKQLHNVNPLIPFLAGELSLLPNLQKGGLSGSQFLEGGYWEKGDDFFQWWVLQFLHKNKLKSVIFNMSKKFINKFFFLCQNYNLNWETLTKNLVILLKDGMGLMITIFDIMGVSLKNLIFTGASQKTNI